MRRSKLLLKTLVFMLSVFGVMAMVSAIFSGRHIMSVLEEEYSSKAMAMASSFADSDLQAILEGDGVALQHHIDRIHEMAGVDYVIVADPSGKVLAHTFAPAPSEEALAVVAEVAKAPASEAKPMVQRLDANIIGEQDFGGSLHAVWPVLQGVGGAIHVGMDRGRIVSEFWSAFLSQQLLTLCLFLGSALLAWFFVRSISKPLLQLADYAKQVASHNFTHPMGDQVNMEAQDEVGTLARSMQSMAKDLERQFQALSSKATTATHDMEDALAYLSAIINSMPNGLLVVNSQGKAVRFNTALADVLHRSPEALLGQSCSELLGAENARELGLLDISLSSFPGYAIGQGSQGEPSEQAKGNAASPPVMVKEIAVQRTADKPLPLEVSISQIQLHGDTVRVCILRDITERKLAQDTMRQAKQELEEKVKERTRELTRANAQLKLEAAERTMVGEALRKAEARYRTIFENAVEGIFQMSTEGRYLAANPALARIFGYETPDQFMAAMAMDPSRHILEEDSFAEFLRRINVFSKVQDFQMRVCTLEEAVVWISMNGHRVVDRTGETLYIEGSVEDMTLRKEMENALRQQAFHDPLTGLPNRMLFQDHLQLALERSKRRPDYLFAVLYMDLDRFKIINDSLGHDAGDNLLKAIARSLEECVRTSDTVARFGGDEFAILLEEIDAPREAVRIARRILEDIAKPLMLTGHEVYTTGSMGIVLVTDGYERSDSILRDADTAMYKAKEQGKARFKVFNQKMHEQALRIMELESELRRAVERQEIQVYYQPIIDLKAQRIAGFEALSRWIHPRHGFIPPSEFIPLAEDTGLIVPLGAEVLRAACSTLLTWHALFHEQGLGAEALPRMSVNISGKQFLHPSLVADVEGILEETGLDPSYLVLEITENVLMVNTDGAGSMLGKLKRLGVSISMDDFGTGYSSLSYLRQFPIDHIKIDRGFVNSCHEDAESLAIIKTVLSLGHALGMSVVAEGVETVEQMGLLRQKLCQYGQGYLFSRPLPMEQMQEYLLAQMHACHEDYFVQSLHNMKKGEK